MQPMTTDSSAQATRPMALSSPPNAELERDIREGRFSQLDLIRHVQNLEGLGELRAAANLCALWINGAPALDKHFSLFNLGGLLQSLGRMDEAEQAYESCLALRADFVQAAINLGLLREKLGRTNEALSAWLTVVARRFLEQPPSAEFLTMALNHIGRVQEQLKNYAQAEEALEQSLRIDPKQPGVIQHWVHIRQKACQWPVYKPLPGVSLAEMRRYTSPLAMLALTEEPAEQLAVSQAFVARTYGHKEERLCQGASWRHERLRIGYVSADFREHAVGFLLPPFLQGHAPDRYELYAYDHTREENTALRQQFKGLFSHFRSIAGLSDRQAAELILSDEIDVLIDLHGLSAGARPGIFALHPAPRQGTYLGFIGPTGMPWYDFVVADRQVLPPELAVHFSEKPAYVDGSFLPMVSYLEPSRAVTRSEVQLPDQAFVMASFGNSYKITPEVFSAWLRLLQRIPQSVLWLIDDNAVGTRNLRQAAQQAGIDPQRLVFMPRVAHAEFCARLKLADVYLDTYPYNCGSTSNDVIAAGLPLVTRYGRTMVSRMGLSLMHAAQTPQLAVATEQDYEDKVLEVYLKKKAGTFAIDYRITPTFDPQGALEQVLGNAVLPELSAALAPQAKAAPQVQLFHIGYSSETLSQAPAQFIALDNRANARPDWREYWPIRNHLLQTTLDDDVFYGFFSPRFSYKTSLDHEKIRDFVHQHGQEHDVLIFSPFWDLCSFFINPFQQGEFFHPGLLECAQAFSNHAGLGLDLAEQVMHSDNTVFCNYFIAKKRFWLRWLELGEELFSVAESGQGPLAHLLMSQSRYSEQFLPHKIFVQERLVNLVLASGEFRSKAVDMYALPGSVTPLNHFMPQAIEANALKYAFAQLGQPSYLNAYRKLREQVWRDSGMDVLAQLREHLKPH
jgi:predicted O-linked N-acetylglucosamine transferase (SPINDLY family)